MDFLIEEKTLDLSVQKSLHSLENNFSIFEFSVIEDDTMFESSFTEFKIKALDIIKDILDSIKKFFKSIATQIHIHVQKIELNKKLSEMKEIMAKKRAKAMGLKYSYFDIKKYKLYYTDFIDRYTEELIKGLNKDFKDVSEYENWHADMLNKLSDFNFTLSDEEQWKISMSINSAVKLSEEEAKNREKNLKMVEDQGDRSIKKIESYYKQIDTERSFVNYDGKHINIMRLQNSFIVKVCNKIMQGIKAVAKFIVKHTFGCVIGILALLIAL